jgi:hypothetical protein
MNLPADVHAVVKRFAITFPVPQGAPGTAHEQRCREWSIKVAQQVAHQFGTTWGVKKASPTRPISKDSLAFNGDGLHSWDLLKGAGSGTPELAANPQHHDISNQVFVVVTPLDHLGGQVGPDPIPVAPDPISVEPDPVSSERRFDETLAIMHEAAAKWRQIHGKGPTELDEGQAHLWLWRLLMEGVTRERLLDSVT